MNMYQILLEKIKEGKTDHFIIALLAIVYFLIGTIGMTETNLADLMTRLGYTFNISTSIFNDGTKDYSINDLISFVITNIYPNDDAIRPATIVLLIMQAHDNKDKNGNTYISDDQYNTLIANLAKV